MREKINASINRAISDAENAAHAWVVERKGNIGDTVTRMLDSRVKDIVAKLLGFDYCFGDLSVDHCNGRSGESAAGDWIRKQAGDAVREWLTTQAGDLPVLPEKAVKNLRKAYLDAFEDELREALIRKAKSDAQDELARIVAEFGVDASDDAGEL